MNAIRIRKTIDSDTLHLPELKDMIGRTVEIIILEEPTATIVPSGFVPGNGDWDALLVAAQQLQDYDYQAQIDQDACDIRAAEVTDRVGREIR
ncbi:MAG TPA: hypothetical protein DDY78_21650 [Planctomycetales bacterium]|jgi:hypothetical protein|nr:hypothetical protein [Planctomycetales bacterium]